MHRCHGRRCLVPPSPEVFQQVLREYRTSSVAGRITFEEYLKIIGFTDPSVGRNGMDDGFLLRTGPSGPELFSIPQHKVTGDLRILVLLVDFPDRPGQRPVADYESLLFEHHRQPTGSLYDYYQAVSNKKVSVQGSVTGWLRLPQPSSYYTDGTSGMNAEAYPHNAQRMAEDAIHVAKAAGVEFPADLDKLGQGVITALFIVHAGRGAESLDRSIRGKYIWSHKWIMNDPIDVHANLAASVYLTVPEDCELGVCAHELGHLAFQWEDFYDANYNEDGQFWDGSGNWDLMASGSYNGESLSPAYPVGLHRLQHGWVSSRQIMVEKGTNELIDLPTDEVVIIRSTSFTSKQYLLAETRKNRSFDQSLPGHGLLLWRVDEANINTTATSPGLCLLEADNNNALLTPGDYNQGDDGDPFPGRSNRQSITPTGVVSTSFPRSKPSHVTIDEISEGANSVSFRVLWTK